MAAVRNALVVGAGIGGLTAATALRRRGIAVDLVEINPDHGVYGVGIIQPNNTLRALDSIGLAQTCLAQGGAFPGWRIFDHEGTFIADAPGTSDAAPHLPPVNGITRPRLQQILLQSARDAGTNIRVGMSMERWRDDGDGVDVTLTDGSRGRYDVVVGSEGLYSPLRQELFPNAPAPTYSGQSVWRYNFVRPPEVEWGAIYYGQTTKVGLVPMSPTQMYIFVVTEEAGDRRMQREGLANKLRDRLAEYGGIVATLRDQVTDDDAVVYRPMEHLLLPAPWHKGRIILIGDSVHATTPHLAQGAAMAIEDAVLLADLLGRDAPLAPLFDEFMKRRFARAKYVIDSSQTLAGWELESWQGTKNPAADFGRLLSEATQKLMEAY